MISIVTAYYNRKRLLIRTLDSLQIYFGKVDFEMIVVDDGSREEERLENLLSLYPFLRLRRIEPKDKWYSNPCIPFNIGFEMALGEKIILQNPECYHFGNILEYVDQNLSANKYLSFGCFSLDKENTDRDELFFDTNNIERIIEKSSHVVMKDGALGWYNHSKYRPQAYHFCSAIMAEDLVDLGGFDPRYALGYGYDDDDLIFRIRLKGMKVKFIDDCVVLHQNHYIEPSNNAKEISKYNNEKAGRNRYIYEMITTTSYVYRANYLRISSVDHVSSKPYVGKILSEISKFVRLFAR